MTIFPTSFHHPSQTWEAQTDGHWAWRTGSSWLGLQGLAVVTVEKGRAWSAVMETGHLLWAGAPTAELQGFRLHKIPFVSFCIQSDSKSNPGSVTAWAEHCKGTLNLSPPFLDHSDHSKNPRSLQQSQPLPRGLGPQGSSLVKNSPSNSQSSHTAQASSALSY